MSSSKEELQQRIEELEAQVAHLKSCKTYGLVWEDKEEEFDELSKNAFPILTSKNDKRYPDLSVSQSVSQSVSR